MAGAQIGSFITGLFDGVQARHGWEDRKRRQIQEDEDYKFKREQREWAREDMEWNREDRDWSREDRKHTISEREYELARRNEEDALNRRAADAAAAGRDKAGTEEPAPAPGGRQVKSPFLDPGGPGRAEGLSFGLPAADSRMAGFAPGATGAPAPASGPLPSARDLDSIPASSGLSFGQTAPPAAAPMTIAPRDVTYEEWKSMSRGQREGLGLPVSVIGGEIGFDRFKAGLGFDPATIPVGEQTVSGPVPQGVGGQRDLGFQREGLQDAPAGTVERDRDGNPLMIRGPRADVVSETANPSQQPAEQLKPAPAAGLAGLVAPEEDAAAPAAAPAAQPTEAAAAMGASVQPSLTFAAREIAQPQSKRPKKRKSAVDGFMDAYVSEAVPLLIEGYVRLGKHEEAAAFAEYAKSHEAQKSMKVWAEAAYMHEMGNEEGMLDKVVEGYNMLDDGFSLERSRSGFTRDENGNVTGVDLVFTDHASGKMFKQHFAGGAELMENIIYQMAPEKQFEYVDGLRKQAMESESEFLLGERKHQQAMELQRARGAAGGVSREDAIKFLADNNPQFMTMPDAEKEVEIQKYMDLATGGGAARSIEEPTPLYR